LVNVKVIAPSSTERSSKMRFILTCAAMLALANVPGRLLAEPAKPGSQPPSKVTLYKGLGRHTPPGATSNPEAQEIFDQGLSLMYAFNHDEAVRAFRRAAELDPDCAMAHWGISLSMGKNYNYPLFPPEKAKTAWKALESARAKTKAESEPNRALVEALAARYADPLPKETRQLEEAYAKAMKAVWEKFPNDADIGALYAESLMNLRPWDLWTIDGKPQPETPEIQKVLQAVLELDPKHPLANHLYIHACEASPNPEKADAAADKLRDLQPALGHMVHMPSHIDIRRGRWQAAIEANDRAITADRNYAKTVPEQGFYRCRRRHARRRNPRPRREDGGGDQGAAKRGGQGRQAALQRAAGLGRSGAARARCVPTEGWAGDRGGGSVPRGPASLGRQPLGALSPGRERG